MFLTNNPFSDHGPSKKVLSEAFKYHIPEDIPANERTAFHGAAAAAAKAGKKNFNFGGKTHPVTMKKDTAKSIPTEALDKKDVKTVKGVIKGLKKAVATHSGQVKTLTKDIKDDVAAVKQNKPLQKKLDKLYGPKKDDVNESFSYHNDMAKAHKSHAMRHNSEFHHGNHNYDDEDMHGRAIDIHKQAHAAHIQARNLSSYDSKGEYKKAAKDAHSLSQTAIGTTKDAGKFKTGQPKHKFPKLKLHTKSESTVKEISKNLATKYIGKASRDMYHKGQQQGTADAISRLGGPDQDYKKSPERKAAMRVRGIDRATKRLAKREATIVDPNDLRGRPKKADPNPESKFGIKHPMHPANMAKSKMMPKRMKEAMSDAEKAAHQKAIDAFKAKGGKIKKLKPGFAQGYHGKADPGAGMKGMISPADTKQFGTKKKVGSMK